MSEFFQNFEEEEKKPQKKSVVQYEESSESQDKITNKEKRFGELHEEIFALEDSFTVKKLDAFIKNSKKYKSIFKNGLPDFVKNFFEGALGNKKTNAALKNKITKFLAPYKTESTDEIEQHIPIQEVEIKENNLELILNNKIIDLTKLEDLLEQEKEFRGLVENSNTVGMNFKIYFTLFNLYLKNKVNDYDRVMDLFMTIADLSKKDPRFMDVEFLPILVDNLSYYLNYIISILTEINYSDFETKLNELKSINEKVVSKIILEYQFLTLNKNVETEDVFFKLLHIVRKGEYEEAKKYYATNTIYNQNDRATNTILTELGILAFNSTDYAFAFKLLQQCYSNKFYNGEIYLYVTTILIEEQVIDEPFYDTFLATFRSLDDNPFLCKSGDPKMEIQRAYYYIKNYDNETAKDILARLIPGQNFASVLDSRILIK